MKAIRWMDLHIEEFLLAVLLIIFTVLISANVVLRYLFNGGITWSEAICRYCLVYSTFITIGHWVRRESGICVDFIAQIVPKAVSQLFKWIVRVLQLFFFGFLFIVSVKVLKGTYASGTVDGTLGFNMAYIYFACVLGFFNALVRSIQVIVLNLKKKED